MPPRLRISLPNDNEAPDIDLDDGILDDILTGILRGFRLVLPIAMRFLFAYLRKKYNIPLAEPSDHEDGN